MKSTSSQFGESKQSTASHEDHRSGRGVSTENCRLSKLLSSYEDTHQSAQKTLVPSMTKELLIKMMRVVPPVGKVRPASSKTNTGDLDSNMPNLPKSFKPLPKHVTTLPGPVTT